MASPARAASVSGPLGLVSDAARCSYDQPRRREDFHDNILMRPLVNIYEQDCYSKETVVAAVENCMKKHADNLLHSLEGISGRLSQLELYCYKLERSIGELRSDMMDDHSETDLKFQSFEKHLQEVQKSVQVLQNKQELAETQKELTNLQLAHQDPIQKNEEGFASSMLVAKENDDSTQVAKHELTLVPLHQVNAAQSIPLQFQPYNGLIAQQLVPVSLSTQQDQQQLNQATLYYVQSQSHVEDAQTQPTQSTVRYVQSQVQNPQTQVLVQQPQLTTQAPQLCPQHQQQSAQQFQSQVLQSQPQVMQPQQSNCNQLPPQVVQLQASSPQAQSRLQATPPYPSYGPHQPANPTTEALPRSMVVQSSYSTISSPQRNHHEVVSPGYGQGTTMSLPPAEHNMQQQCQLPQLSHGSFGPQPSKVGHSSVASYTMQGNAQSYNTSYRYPSNSSATVVAVLPQQPPASGSMVFHHLGPQAMHNHPFGEMVEKAARMGYPRDLVESMALKTAAAGQPVDFNALLDKLNGGSNVATPRAWSG